MKQALVTAAVLIASISLVHAGTRADLSGDAIVDFATTMDMPLVTVGNPGNYPNVFSVPSGSIGAVGYDYNIGKFEVTAGQYTEFLNAVAATDTYGLYNTEMGDPVIDLDTWTGGGCNIQRSGSSGSYSYSVAADWADRPVNYVSWGDSARFCNWLTNGMPTGAQDLTTTEDGSYFLDGAETGARKGPANGGRYYLPTNSEWHKAAHHKNDGVTGNYFDYPTSSDTMPGNDLIDPDPGNNANIAIGPGDGYAIGSPYYRTEVGEFENSDSPYGAFDMGGNVCEWTETPGMIGYNVRGASWSWESPAFYYMPASEYREGYADPTYESPAMGFRVSEVPEVGTMTLLALGGGVGMLRRRKGTRA